MLIIAKVQGIQLWGSFKLSQRNGHIFYPVHPVNPVKEK